jgi:hypothetical protein
MKWRVYDIEWDKHPDTLTLGREPKFKFSELPKETVVETGDFNGFYETDMERRQEMIDEIAEELIDAWEWNPDTFCFKEIT